MRPVLLVLLLLLAGCATAPSNINNVCAVFAQRDGWFNDWRRAAERSERTYGVPASILMATVRVESGYRARARPPRTKLLGFIPWKRPSSAYGYSKALDGTWAQYKAETGNWGASRHNFADAIDFVGWYHRKSHDKNGIALNDAYNLYLAYYAGHGGYARRAWSAHAEKAAARAAAMANAYAAQMRTCPG